jgi:hypothetical protein
MKRGALIGQFGHLVPLGVEILCICAFRPSDTVREQAKTFMKKLFGKG